MLFLRFSNIVKIPSRYRQDIVKISYSVVRYTVYLDSADISTAVPFLVRSEELGVRNEGLTSVSVGTSIARPRMTGVSVIENGR